MLIRLEQIISKILKFNPHSSSFYRENRQDSLLCMSDLYINLNVSVKSNILANTDWQTDFPNNSILQIDKDCSIVAYRKK